MMRILFRVAAIGTLLALGGCANATMVESNKLVTLGNGLSVTARSPWNQISGDHVIWTTQGINVDSVHFVTGVKSGDPVVRIGGVSRDSQPLFDAKMLPNDVQDLIVTTLTRQGYQNVRAGALAPCPFGAVTGFCFDLNFNTPDGLEMKGMVMARKKDDKLDAFLFQAPGEYYFAQLQPAVKDVFASVQAK
jgi:hypothetical protein